VVVVLLFAANAHKKKFPRKNSNLRSAHDLVIATDLLIGVITTPLMLRANEIIVIE
jgi:hypothetical protein